MKIVAIDTYPLVLPVQEIYGGAAGFLEDCRSLIVRVETESGIEGWGEATQGRPGNTYETLETMEIMARKYFVPALMEMDLEDTGAVLLKLHRARQGHPIAKAAIEMALYDALGKLYRLPLCPFFGGPYRREIDLVGGLGMDLGPQAIGVRAAELKREGFVTFKIKIGQQNHRNDIERVRAVRQAVGDEASIRVDGNGSYSFVDARSVLNELRQFRIADAEQPLARGDLSNLVELRRAVWHSDRGPRKRDLRRRCAKGVGRASSRSLKDQTHTHRRISKSARSGCGGRSEGTSGGRWPGKRVYDDSFRR